MPASPRTQSSPPRRSRSLFQPDRSMRSLPAPPMKLSTRVVDWCRVAVLAVVGLRSRCCAMADGARPSWPSPRRRRPELVAGAAVEHVGVVAAHHAVVAVAAEEAVGPVVARGLDVAGATVEQVRALAAAEAVGRVAAGDRVVAVAAAEEVAVWPTVQRPSLPSSPPILSVPARPLASPSAVPRSSRATRRRRRGMPPRSPDGRRRGTAVSVVVAAAAGDGVVALAAGQHVVAVTAGELLPVAAVERVVAPVAPGLVVAVAAGRHVVAAVPVELVAGAPTSVSPPRLCGSRLVGAAAEDAAQHRSDDLTLAIRRRRPCRRCRPRRPWCRPSRRSSRCRSAVEDVAASTPVSRSSPGPPSSRFAAPSPVACRPRCRR